MCCKLHLFVDFCNLLCLIGTALKFEYGERWRELTPQNESAEWVPGFRFHEACCVLFVKAMIGLKTSHLEKPSLPLCTVGLYWAGGVGPPLPLSKRISYSLEIVLLLPVLSAEDHCQPQKQKNRWNVGNWKAVYTFLSEVSVRLGSLEEASPEAKQGFPWGKWVGGAMLWESHSTGLSHILRST